jgi:hypothetical protein
VVAESLGASIGFLGPAKAAAGQEQLASYVIGRGRVLISGGQSSLYAGAFTAFDLSNFAGGAWSKFSDNPLQIVTTFTTKAVPSETIQLSGSTIVWNPYAQWLVTYAGGVPMSMEGVKATYNNGAVTVTHPPIAGAVLAILAN